MAARDEDLTTLVPLLDAALRTWIDAQRRLHGVPGIQVAIRHGRELLFSYASGVADTATGEALTTAHAFRIASHSKTFTSTAVMQLVEQGALRLDDTVGELLPEMVGSPLEHATVRQLLDHQSGAARDGRDAAFWQLLREFPDRDGVLEELREPRVYAPNEHFHYSNLTFSLLGLILEEITGQAFTAIAEAMVQPLADYQAEPVVLGADLGVGTTGPDASGHAVAESELFDGGDPVARVIAPVDTRAEAAATGFRANAETISAWAAAHALGTDMFLSDDAKRQVQRVESTIATPAGPRHYGLGWGVSEIGERHMFGHSGGFPGHITSTLADAETGLAVSVLTNRIDGPAGPLLAGVIALLDKALEVVSDVTAAATLPEAGGRFLALWNDMFLIPLPGAVLRVNLAETDPAARAMVLRVDENGELRAEAADGFGDQGEVTTIERDASGAVTAITATGVTAWREDEYRRRLPEMLRGPRD